MAKKHYGDIELISGAIINLEAENVSADPAFDAAGEGRIIYNTTQKAYKYNNGTSWVTFEVSLTSTTELVDTLGSNWINPDFSFDPTDFNALDNLTGLTTGDSLYSVIEGLDAAITSALSVTTLRGVNLDFTSGSLVAGNIVYFNGIEFVAGTVNDLDLVNIGFDELIDTDFTSQSNDQIAVYENGLWRNKPIFYKYQELSRTLNTFTVNHSLGEQFCHVTIIDMSFTTPRRISNANISSIEYNSSSTLTVSLNVNKPVTIIVSSLDFA